MADTTPDYSEDVQAPTADSLATLTALARQQRQAELDVEEAQEKLKQAQGRLRELAEGQIPTLMKEVGMETFKTTDGLTIKVKEQLRVSVPKAKKREACSWVDDHGGSALLQRAFHITFTKEQEKFAAKFERDCKQRKMPLPMERYEDVHPSTLKKFLTDKLEAGDDVPLELFGAYHQRVAKIEV